METLSVIYDQQVDFEAIPDYSYFDKRKNNLDAFVIATKTTGLIVDHFKRCTYLFHNNAKCISLFGHIGHKEVADNFLENFVHEDDLRSFSTIITAINIAVRGDFLKGDQYLYFSFNIMLQPSRRKGRQYSFKAIPFLFTPDNKPWITVYQIEPCFSSTSGNLTLYSLKTGSRYRFNIEKKKFYKSKEAWKLSDTEKKILQLSAEGSTERQIAGIMDITVSSLKNMKIKMFERMNVNTIYAAISEAFKHGLIE